MCVILYGLGAVYFVPAAQKSNETYEVEKEDQQENETTDFWKFWKIQNFVIFVKNGFVNGLNP